MFSTHFHSLKMLCYIININIIKSIISNINNQTIIHPIRLEIWFFTNSAIENVHFTIIMKIGRINPIFGNGKCLGNRKIINFNFILNSSPLNGYNLYKFYYNLGSIDTSKNEGEKSTYIFILLWKKRVYESSNCYPQYF